MASWRGAVIVTRGDALERAMRDPAASGRATAFTFAGSGGTETWMGTVTLAPGGRTGAHHHGRPLAGRRGHG